MLKMGASYSVEEFNKVRDEIDDAMDGLIHRIADRILHESQINVPVDNSTLKKSANIILGKGYAFIGYNTKYAQVVHDGWEGGEVSIDPYTRKAHNRKGHKRTNMNGVVIRVKPHGVKEHNVRSHTKNMPEVIGRPYLDKAIKKVLGMLDENVRNSIEIVRWDREI